MVRNKTLLVGLLLFSILLFVNDIPAQSTTKTLIEDLPPELKMQLLPKNPAPYQAAKKPGLLTAEEWGELIDSTWGPGLPVDTQLQIYSDFWNNIDDFFACWQDLELDWDSVWIADSTTIANDTLSKGRFSALLNYAAFALLESHTIAADWDLYETALVPGTPLFSISGYGYSSFFGAGLTPLPDSTLLVYKAIPSHPLDLEPGDLVLG